MSDGRGFRETVTFVECAARHALELFDHFDGQRRRAAIEDAYLVKSVLARAWMIEQRDVDRGHGRKVCGAVIADRREQSFDIVLRDQDLLRAAPRALKHADREAIDVKEGEHEQ